jgi:hypothetical protein
MNPRALSRHLFAFAILVGPPLVALINWSVRA